MSEAIGSMKIWLIYFLMCTVIGLFSFSTYTSGSLLERDNYPLIYILINELTGAYGVFLLLPFLLRFINRFPVRKDNWYSLVPIHLLATLVYGIAHTTIMTVSRIVLYNWFDLKPYETGDLFYRYLMEYHKQFLIYWVIYAGVATYRYYQATREKEKRAAELEVQTAQLQSQLTQSQLDFLKGQIQPHFLFNTLNLISSCMYEDVRKADKMISRLSGLLRMSLESSGHSKVPMRKEIDFLEQYLEIMKSRFEDRLQVELEADPKLNDALVPAFIMQPLVENAIKHNPQETSETVFVRIEITAGPDELTLSVTDNGPGIRKTPDRLTNQGTGLLNTRERLKQLYGEKAHLHLQNVPDCGLRVRIAIPLEFTSEIQNKEAPGVTR